MKIITKKQKKKEIERIDKEFNNKKNELNNEYIQDIKNIFEKYDNLINNYIYIKKNNYKDFIICYNILINLLSLKTLVEGSNGYINIFKYLVDRNLPNNENVYNYSYLKEINNMRLELVTKYNDKINIYQSKK